MGKSASRVLMGCLHVLNVYEPLLHDKEIMTLGCLIVITNATFNMTASVGIVDGLGRESMSTQSTYACIRTRIRIPISVQLVSMCT